MKKFLIVCLVCLLCSICSGNDLSEAQKNVIKQYPTLNNKQKIECFKILSDVYTKGCPITIDKMTEITSIQHLNNKPGLYYTVKLSVNKTDYSKKDWEEYFKKIHRNSINGMCSNPQYFFFKKLKDVHFVYDYVDKHNMLLKRFSYYMVDDCNL